MPASNQITFESSFAALQSSYAANLLTSIAEIDTRLQRILCLGHGNLFREQLKEVLQSLHKTVGSAATFGFPEVSEAARNLEVLLSPVLCVTQPLTDAQINRIQDVAMKMKEGASRCGNAQDLSAGNPVSESGILDKPIFLIHEPSDASVSPTDSPREIGCDAVVTHSLDDALDQISRTLPKAILISSTPASWQQIAGKISEKVRQLFGTDVPVLCLADENSFESQLQALRAGTDGLLVEPVRPGDLMRLIEEKADTNSFEPFRVLIVEDDKELASQCASALEGPGYVTEICGDPNHVFSLIESFDPEIIVADMRLPQCSGLELAKIVWRNDFARHIEFTFLSPGGKFNDAAGTLGLTLDRFVTMPMLRLSVARLAANVKSGIECPSRHHLRSVLDNQDSLNLLQEHLGMGERTEISSIMQPVPHSPKKPTVLVVDDDPYIVKAITAKLESFDLLVLQAFNAEEALTLVYSEFPEVIISDFEMPNGSADYLLSRLNSDPETSDIPVLILTARAVVDGKKDYAHEREMLGRHGAVSYLTKPVDWNALVSELHHHISF